MMENTRQIMYKLISDKFGVDEDILMDDTDFYDDLGVDSLDFVDLIASIEHSLNIVIEEEAYEKLKTVGALFKLVEKRLKAKLAYIPA